MVASSTIRFNRLDNIMYSFEAPHFRFPGNFFLVLSKLHKRGKRRKLISATKGMGYKNESTTTANSLMRFVSDVIVQWVIRLSVINLSPPMAAFSVGHLYS